MRTTFLVFLGSAFFFLFIASGYVDTIDAAPSLRTAQSLWKNHTFAVEWVPRTGSFYSVPKENEKSHSKMGLLMPILYVPCVALGEWATWFGLSETRATEFFVSLVNPLLSALLACVLFLFFRMSRSVRDSLSLTLITVSGSLLLPYSKTCHREPLQALLLIAAFYFIERKKTQFDLSLAATFLGLGVLTKAAFLVPASPLVFLVLWRERQKALVSFLFPFSLFLGLHLFFNYWLFGQFLAGGYSARVMRLDPRVWKTDAGIGFWAQWAWSYRGLLYYSPILLGLIFIARTSWRVSSLITVFCAVLFQTLLYSKWTDPFGGQALGPRYLVVVLPLLLILFRDFEWKSLVAVPASCLIVVSILLQVTLTSVKLQQYYTLESRSPKSFKAPAWVVTPRLFLHKLRGNAEIYPLSTFNIKVVGLIDVRDVPSLEGLNFWWLHFYRKGLQYVSQDPKYVVKQN